MALPDGALAAPEPPKIGLGSTKRPRSVTRRNTPRGRKIAKAVAEQRRSRMTRSGGTTAPNPTTIYHQNAQTHRGGRMKVTGRNAGVDPGYGRPTGRPSVPVKGQSINGDIGAQLSRRVNSGAIDQTQADQVAKDRALLRKVYGPNWRDKVFGGTGRVRRLRQTASSAEPGDSKKRLATLMAKRKSFLEKAQAAGE